MGLPAVAQVFGDFRCGKTQLCSDVRPESPNLFY